MIIVVKSANVEHAKFKLGTISPLYNPLYVVNFGPYILLNFSTNRHNMLVTSHKIVNVQDIRSLHDYIT